MLNPIDMKYRFGFLITTEKHLLSSASIDVLERWNILECGEAAIAYHYEAKLAEFHFENHNAYTLGDIFVAHGTRSLREILQGFVETDDWESIDNLSGRFAIIVTNKQKHTLDKVFADPFGSRTLFYSTAIGTTVSSHATLLAETIKIKRSKPTIEFVKSADFQLINTKFLPADLTIYEGIFGMPANHYYSFKDKRAVRFWPRSDIKACDPEYFFSTTTEYFERYIDYFTTSGIKPIIGLTGGVDCRALIAAWNQRKSHFKCLTWNRGLSDDEQAIIADIRSHIRADCYVLDPKKALVGEHFDALRNIGYVNRGEFLTKATLTAQTAEFVDPSNAFVRGLGGEILRGMFNKGNSYQRNLDDFTYALNLFKTRKISKPSKEFMSFLERSYEGFFGRMGLGEFRRYNYDFGDMIYWEQRMSMWAASLLNEADPALKNFAGLNSRRMYEASYGLPPEERFQRELLLKITRIFDGYLADLPAA